MQRFTIQTLATATIRETWTVEASSLDKAKAAIIDGDWEGVNMIDVTDETVGDETDREVTAAWKTGGD